MKGGGSSHLFRLIGWPVTPILADGVAEELAKSTPILVVGQKYFSSCVLMYIKYKLHFIDIMLLFISNWRG
jgi:hypothetical protein